MLQQRLHARQQRAVEIGGAGLKGKPFVEHQIVVPVALVHALERRFGQRVAAVQQRLQRLVQLGHVGGVFAALVGFAGPDRVAAGARG